MRHSARLRPYGVGGPAPELTGARLPAGVLGERALLVHKGFPSIVRLEARGEMRRDVKGLTAQSIIDAYLSALVNGTNLQPWTSYSSVLH